MEYLFRMRLILKTYLKKQNMLEINSLHQCSNIVAEWWTSHNRKSTCAISKQGNCSLSTKMFYKSQWVHPENLPAETRKRWWCDGAVPSAQDDDCRIGWEGEKLNRLPNPICTPTRRQARKGVSNSPYKKIPNNRCEYIKLHMKSKQ